MRRPPFTLSYSRRCETQVLPQRLAAPPIWNCVSNNDFIPRLVLFNMVLLCFLYLLWERIILITRFYYRHSRCQFSHMEKVVYPTTTMVSFFLYNFKLLFFQEMLETIIMDKDIQWNHIEFEWHIIFSTNMGYIAKWKCMYVFFNFFNCHLFQRPIPASFEEMTKFHSDDYMTFLKNIRQDNISEYTKQMQRFNVGEVGFHFLSTYFFLCRTAQCLMEYLNFVSFLVVDQYVCCSLVVFAIFAFSSRPEVESWSFWYLYKLDGRITPCEKERS